MIEVLEHTLLQHAVEGLIEDHSGSTIGIQAPPAN
jgi:hypothetical protein